jgi:hypothetical protein
VQFLNGAVPIPTFKRKICFGFGEFKMLEGEGWRGVGCIQMHLNALQENWVYHLFIPHQRLAIPRNLPLKNPDE